MKQSVSVCLESRAQFSYLCKTKKKEEPVSHMFFGLFVGICFCLHSWLAAVFNKGSGIGEKRHEEARS